MDRLRAALRRVVPSTVRRRLMRRGVRPRPAGPSPATSAPTEHTRELRQEALAHSRAQRWEAAATGWLAVLEASSGVPDARTFAQLARAQRQLGDVVGALKTIQNGQQHHPDDEALKVERAQLAVVEQDWESASRYWEALIRETAHPDARNYTRWVRALRRGGDPDAAQQAVQEGQARFPADPGLAAEHAQLASTARDWPLAVERWRTAVDLAGDSPATRSVVQLAKALQHQGLFAAAVEVVERGLEHDPEHPELLERHAKLAVADRDWQVAAERWRTALALNPAAPPEYHRHLARVLTEAGDHEAADAALRTGLERHPETSLLAVERANLATNRADWDEARARWDEAVAERGPIDPRVRAGFAQRCAAGFQHDLADAVVAAGLDEEPDQLDLRLQHVRNAITRQRRDRAPDDWDWTVAMERSRTLLQEPTLTPDATLRLATLLADATALEEAVEILDTVLTERPHLHGLRAERQELRMALGRWTAVIEEPPPSEATEGAGHGSDPSRDAVLRSRAHQARGELTEALATLAPLADLDRPRWAREVARAHATAGSARDAADAWRRARDAEPPSKDLDRRLAIALRRAGDDSAASALCAATGLERNPGVVAIIGGGPSLTGTDLAPLRGVVHTVAVNATATMLPWCDVAVTHDASHLAERFLGFPNRVVAGLPAERLRTIGRLRNFELRRRFVTDRLSELDDVVHSGGHTSAHTALNYAYALRPSRIVLFGIDLTDFWGPNDYWHGSMDTHNRRRFQTLSARPIYDEWQDYRTRKLRNAPAVFATTVPQLRQAGIEVWNASPESSLTCFPRISPDEGLQRCSEDA